MTVKKNLIEQNEIEYKMGKNNFNVEIFEKFSSYIMQIFPNNFFVFKNVKFMRCGCHYFFKPGDIQLSSFKERQSTINIHYDFKKCIR